MTEFAPYLTAILSGILIPAIIWAVRTLSKQATVRAAEVKSEVITQAEAVAKLAAQTAIDVAHAATARGEAIEVRLTELLERNNRDVLETLARISQINGKVAAVMSQQAVDHDRIVWLLGKAGESILDNPKEATPERDTP